MGEKPGVEETQPSHSSRMDFIILLLLTLPALYPLIGTGISASHDGLHHIFRLFDLVHCVRGGAILPRWLPDLGFGYGYPILNYYSPLSYYLALPFMALGSGPILSIKMVYALGFFGAAFAMYGLSRPFLGRQGAILAAITYTYLPYHLADVYVRGAEPEFLTFAIIPFTLWAMYRTIADESTAHAALAGLGLAALILTHNVSAVMAMPLIVVFAVVMAWVLRGWRQLGWIGLAAALAALATSFYWLPALAEIGAVRASQVTHKPALVLSQLVSLQDLLSPYFLHRYFPNQGRPIEHPFGLIPMILALPSLAFMLLRWRRLRPIQRAWVGICWAVVAGTAIMMLPLSAPLWKGVPGLLYLLNPWRWQLIASFGIAGVMGCWLIDIRRPMRDWESQPNRLGWVAVLTLSGLLAVAGLAELPTDAQLYPGQDRILLESDVSLEGMAAYEHELFLATRLWDDPKSLEYVPVWVEESTKELILPPAAPASPEEKEDAPFARLEVKTHAPLRSRLKVTANEGTALRMHTFYFPGWRAKVDGEAVDTYPSMPLGLLTMTVPAGEHDVSIYFGQTPIRWVGLILSLIALSGVAVWLVITKRGRVLAYMAIALVVFIGVWMWQGQKGTTHSPVAKWTNFGDQFALTGYQMTLPKPAEQSLTLDLWWLSLEQPAENHKIFIHLEDSAGHRWAQRDAQPVFDMAPTTRWGANELVWDHHTLHLPADLPDGDYAIYVGIYQADTVTNLDLLDEMKNPMGQRLLLDTVRLP